MSEENFTPPEKFKSEVDKSEEVVVIPRTVFNYVIIAFTFLIVGVLIGLFAIDRNSQSSGLTETQVEIILRRVLADVNISGDGSSEDVRLDLVDDDPYLGEEDAPIVIVEFSDFFCTFCKRHFDQTFTPILENYGQFIRYVYRDYAQLTPESEPAANAAQCAFEQGQDVFWDFHNEFFNNQDLLGRDFYIATAEKYGLDIDVYTSCLDEYRYGDEVGFDYLDGQLEGVRGTPGFFINGVFISGAQPYNLFERVIQRELIKVGIDPDSITAQAPDESITTELENLATDTENMDRVDATEVPTSETENMNTVDTIELTPSETEIEATETTSSETETTSEND